MRLNILPVLFLVITASACVSSDALKAVRVAQANPRIAQFTTDDAHAAAARARALGHPERADCYEATLAYVSGGQKLTDLPKGIGAASAIELENEAADVQDEPIPDDLIKKCAPVLLRGQEARRRLMNRLIALGASVGL
jgi:hypothetical protein